MSSHLTELKKILDSLNSRIDAMCTDACEKFGMDKDKVLKEIDCRRTKKRTAKKGSAEDCDDTVSQKDDEEQKVDVSVEDGSNDNDGWADFFGSSVEKGTVNRKCGKKKEDDGDGGADDDKDGEDDEGAVADDNDEGKAIDEGDDSIENADDGDEKEMNGETVDNYKDIDMDADGYRERLQSAIDKSGISGLSVDELLKSDKKREELYKGMYGGRMAVDDDNDGEDDLEDDDGDTVDADDSETRHSDEGKAADGTDDVDYDTFLKGQRTVQKRLAKGWKSSDAKLSGDSADRLSEVIEILKEIEKAQRRSAKGDGPKKTGFVDKAKKTIKGAVSKVADRIGPTTGLVADLVLGESSSIKSVSLYDRASSIFDSVYGINESSDGYTFDDYVAESKIDNGILTCERKIDESAIYYGGSMMVSEAFGGDDDEFDRLLKTVARGSGGLKLSDLRRSDSDTDEIRRAKKRLLELIAKGELSDRVGFNAKEAKKAIEMSTRPGGGLTDIQLWHKGLDDTARNIEDNLSRYFVPQEVTRKLDIPKNLGRAAGAGLGALAFGPVGAIAGTALANWLANNHEKYKVKQYAALHGGRMPDVDDRMSRYTGSLVGAGLGSLIGGPAGGIIGAGLGHLGQKGYEFLKSKFDGRKSAESKSANG